MPGSHSWNSPSDAERWTACPGALNLTHSEFEDEGSDFAKEGTILHGIAEDCLEWGFPPHFFVGQTRTSEGYSYEMTPQDAEHMQAGLDRIDEYPGELLIEYRADTTLWVGLDPEGKRQGGTIDVLKIADTSLLVFDWKWGAGVPVYAEGNKQLRIYALGAWSKLTHEQQDRIETVTIVIWQPRIPGAGGEWTITVAELLEFGEWVKERAEGTKDPDAPRCAGEKQCFWCPAAKVSGMCHEHEQWRLEQVGMDFDDLEAAVEFGLTPDLPDIRTLTKEQRSWLVTNAKSFEKWLGMLHAETLADALAGDETPGLKAVEGQLGNRTWTDESVAETFLKKRLKEQDIFTKKLISAPQAEKLLSTKDWEQVKKQRLYHQAPGKPILVPETDERPALVQDLSSEFEDLSDQDAFDDLGKT